jgi:hypothetical protein
MFAANEPVDVSLSPMQYLASDIDQGIAQPIDGLPGVEQYVRERRWDEPADPPLDVVAYSAPQRENAL